MPVHARPSVPYQRTRDVATADSMAVRSYKTVSSGIKVTSWPVTFGVLMVFKGTVCFCVFLSVARARPQLSNLSP